MAALGTTAALPPDVSPGFAVVCSFLERYGSVLDLPELSFPQLERYLQETSAGELCERLGLCLSGQAPHLYQSGVRSLKVWLVGFSLVFVRMGIVSPTLFKRTAKWRRVFESSHV